MRGQLSLIPSQLWPSISKPLHTMLLCKAQIRWETLSPKSVTRESIRPEIAHHAHTCTHTANFCPQSLTLLGFPHLQLPKRIDSSHTDILASTENNFSDVPLGVAQLWEQNWWLPWSQWGHIPAGLGAESNHKLQLRAWELTEVYFDLLFFLNLIFVFF